jgi:hypothetical protein
MIAAYRRLSGTSCPAKVRVRELATELEVLYYGGTCAGPALRTIDECGGSSYESEASDSEGSEAGGEDQYGSCSSEDGTAQGGDRSGGVASCTAITSPSPFEEHAVAAPACQSRGRLAECGGDGLDAASANPINFIMLRQPSTLTLTGKGSAGLGKEQQSASPAAQLLRAPSLASQLQQMQGVLRPLVGDHLWRLGLAKVPAQA